MFGVAALAGWHGEGMPADTGATCAWTQVSQPIPREETFDRHDKLITIRRNDLEEGLGACLEVVMHQNLPSLVEEATIQRPGVESDPTVCLMLCGVESPEVSSAS